MLIWPRRTASANGSRTAVSSAETDGQRLWQSWKTWAEVNNEPAGTRKSFADMVIEHGYLAEKSQHVRGYAGIDLKPPPDRDPLDFA